MGGPSGAPLGQVIYCKELQGNVRNGLLLFLRSAMLTQHQCLQWIASISKVNIDVCGVSVWHWPVHCVGVSVNKPTNSRQTRGGEGGGATATVAVQN